MKKLFPFFLLSLFFFDSSACFAAEAKMTGFPVLVLQEFMFILLFVPVVYMTYFILVKYYEVPTDIAKKLAFRFQIFHFFILVPLIWLLAYIVQSTYQAWEPLALTTLSEKLYAISVQSAWHVYDRSWLFPVSGYFLISFYFIGAFLTRGAFYRKYLPSIEKSELKKIRTLTHVTDYIFILSAWALISGTLIAL